MSSARNTTLPPRQLDATAAPPNFVSNNNLGAGVQKNFSQMGGSHNTQVNAETVNYYGEHDLETHSLAFRSTNSSITRTNKDPTSAILHRALPSRSTLCRPTTAGRARREAICMEQESCTSGSRWRGVRDVYNPLNKQKADGLQQVAARHRVLLPCPQQITRSMDVLGPCQRSGTVRCRHTQARMGRWYTWLQRPEVRRVCARVQLVARSAERQMDTCA
jgi:hypothetical protein